VGGKKMKIIVTKKSDMKIHISSLENEIRKLKDEIKDLELINSRIIGKYNYIELKNKEITAENEELKAKYNNIIPLIAVACESCKFKDVNVNQYPCKNCDCTSSFRWWELMEVEDK
jgi:hypothetical protein